MPNRPSDPRDPSAYLGDKDARIRALERRLLDLPDSANPLQVFESGAPLGDARFIDFGANLNATLIGDDFIQVHGTAGGEGGWDAIVDSTLTASDPDARLFLGIGEALTFLGPAGLNLARAFVLVRLDDSVSNLYVETANWTNPNTVILVGQGQNEFASGSKMVTWRHADFAGSSNSSWQFHNIGLDFSTSTTKALGFSGTAADIQCLDCYINLQGTISGFSIIDATAGATGARYFNCTFDSTRTLGGDVTLQNCDFLLRADGTKDIAGAAATSVLYADDIRTASGATTWRLPRTAYIKGLRNEASRLGGGVGSITLTSPASGAYQAYIEARGATLTLAGSPTNLTVLGAYTSITTPSVVGSDNGGAVIDCSVVNSADITGPASIGVGCRRGATITLRGEAISGTVAMTNDFGSSGQWLSFIDADMCSIVAAVDGSLTTGTRKPYNFDASSINNVLVIAGRSTYGTAGVDSGTNNRVLPEGAAPPAAGFAPADADYLVGTANGTLTSEIVVGTTPGGELGGTWGSPTVDPIHSGSAHSDFVPVAGHVNGHVIEDEGTPLTQRSNLNFVGAGVTVTDAAPDTIVTIPGGGGGDTLVAWIGL